MKLKSLDTALIKRLSEERENLDALELNRLSHSEKNSIKIWVDGEFPNDELKSRNGGKTSWNRKHARVWYGTSDRGNKDAVKELCRGTNADGPPQHHFCFERKLWGTGDLKSVCLLILSGKWLPDSLPVSLARFAAIEAWRRVEKARAAAALKDALANQAAREREESEAEMRKEQEEAALMKQKQMKESMLNIPPTTEQDYVEAESLGFSRELVDASATFPCLGPRGGPSTWGRVKRWLFLHKLNEHLPTVGKSFETVRDELIAEHEKRLEAQKANEADRARLKREREEEQQRLEQQEQQKQREQREQKEQREGGGGVHLDAATEALVYKRYQHFELEYREQARENNSGSKRLKTSGASGEGGEGGDGSGAIGVDAAQTGSYWQTIKEQRKQSGLEKILEYSNRMQFNCTPPMLVRCPLCDSTPISEQFLDCRCKYGSFDWTFCHRCNMNSHATKLPCACLMRSQKAQGAQASNAVKA